MMNGIHVATIHIKVRPHGDVVVVLVVRAVMAGGSSRRPVKVLRSGGSSRETPRGDRCSFPCRDSTG